MVLHAAAAFGLDPGSVAFLSGASRQTWRVGDHILRVRPREALHIELAVMAAARVALPVPGVLATVDFGDTTAALFEKLPGAPAGDLDGLTNAEARRRGAECARLHAPVASIRPPELLPDADPTRAAGENAMTAGGLVHLDLHPFNVLIADDGHVSAVLDWANAARGQPDLDRARTLSILTLDPAAIRRRQDQRWVAFTEGWIDAGQLSRVPAAARAWAYRYTLADLAHRYPEPQLAHIRAALTEMPGITG